MHTFKKTVEIKKEEITKLKSNIRLVKAKYVQSFKKSDAKLDSYQKYDSKSGANAIPIPLFIFSPLINF